MSRLDLQTQKELEPKRIEYAKKQLEELGFEVDSIGTTTLKFQFKGETVKLYPYSGWFSGKTVKGGRGIHNLINQIT